MKRSNGSRSSPVYIPGEDSLFLQEFIPRACRNKKTVLDMGAGSGILALAAAKHVPLVVGVDINPLAVSAARKNARTSGTANAHFFRSNLFSLFKRQVFDAQNSFRRLKQGEEPMRFDLIIINPPYLPFNKKFPDPALDGGTHGYEFILRFLEEAGDFLAPRGSILLLFSSLTNREKVIEGIGAVCFSFKELGTKRLFFEELLVYDVCRAQLLMRLEKKGITKVRKCAQGKRGVVYAGTWNQRRVAVKVRRSGSTAPLTIPREARMLALLNNHSIGPRLLWSTSTMLVEEFIEGEGIEPYCAHSARRDIVKVLRAVLGQLRCLDILGLTKQEMHRPVKHIIVTPEGKPMLIDFERCRHDARPKNITQFVQYLVSARFSALLSEKGIALDRLTLLTLSREYKHALIHAQGDNKTGKMCGKKSNQSYGQYRRIVEFIS